MRHTHGTAGSRRSPTSRSIMEQLGPTVEAIAANTAIIERGDVAVTGATGPALAIVRRRAGHLGVPLTIVEAAPLLGWDRNGIDVDLPRLGRTQVGLRGRHQAANVAVADAVLDALEAAGIVTTPSAARRTGYGRAVWPGRLELIRAGGRDIAPRWCPQPGRRHRARGGGRRPPGRSSRRAARPGARGDGGQGR